MNINRFTSPLWDLDCFHIFDDFWADQSDLFWIDTITDTGTALVGDATRGIMTLTPSDGTVADNDEVYLGSANEVFIFATNRPIYGRCRLSFVETAAGVYNAFFGFANAFAADLIVDNGGGPRASGCVAFVEKRDTETAWRLTTRNGATVTSTLSTKSSTMTSGAFQVIEIFIDDWDGVSMKVSAKIDGEYLKDTINNLPIRHTVLIASATEMQVGAGAKLGAATNNDLLLIDYIYASQAR